MAVDAGKGYVELGFKYDPKVLDKFVEDVESMKKSLLSVEENTNQLSETLSNFGGKIKGLFAGAASLITTAGISALANASKELEKANKRFSYEFEGMEAQADKTARRIADSFGLSFREVKKHLVEVQKSLIGEGVGKQEGLRLSESIISQARNVSIKTGRNFEDTLEAFKGFVTDGGTEGIAEIFKKNKHRLKAIQDLQQNVAFKGLTKQARARTRASQLQGFVREGGFAGAYSKDDSLAKATDELAATIADIKDTLLNGVNEPLKAMAKALNTAIIAVTKFVKFIISITPDLPSIPVKKIGEAIGEAASKGKGVFDKAKEFFKDNYADPFELGREYLKERGKSSAPIPFSPLRPPSDKSSPQTNNTRNITNKNVFNISGAGDPQAVARNVVDALSRVNQISNEIA